jgi:voltage-gated sodium channel
VSKFQKTISWLVSSKHFEKLTFIVILINSILIGYEIESGSTPTIDTVQRSILLFFVIEIVLRFIGRKSNQEYLSDGWTYFDIIIVGISFVPQGVFGANLSIFRVLRVLRIFRVLRTVQELRLITSVFFKSLKSILYTRLLFGTFLYAYAALGVSLFSQKALGGVAVRWTGNQTNLDPYGNISEAMFTLFRILTGEDWTDLRYNLLQAAPQSSFVITLFHVSWMVLSAFLLLNLVVGAVINNYDRTMKEFEEGGD